MFDNKGLDKLLRMAEESQKTLDLHMRIFDVNMDETIKKAPEEDKKAIEECKGICQSFINLAKNGKFEEGEELIKKYKDGRKSN